MSNIILPGDPDFKKNIVMGDAYSKTPKAQLAENERQRESENPGKFRYAQSTTAHAPLRAPDPFTKLAQQAGVNNIMTQPMWFSPLHTPQNWQIASKRREVYQWNRFWYENEPKVAAAIDFYARFPMNGFKLECPNRKILSFFEHHIVKKLQLNERVKEISSEYYMLGDVFIHTDISCDLCGGTGIDPDTQESCDHPGGLFKRIFVMNPDWIEVQKSPLTDEPLVVLIPDEELQQIVHKRSPKPIYDRIPDHLKPLIIAKAPIPMSNRTLSHLKHMAVPYGTYGTSIIRRLFTTLAYKTKIMTANWIVAERLILPVRVVKIGSDDRPASTTDIADVQTQLGQVANDPNMTIVTHHNFEYEWYGCHTVDTTNSHVITSRGKVHYSDLTEDDLIATWNAQTGKIEYQNYMRNIEFDYNKDNSSGKAFRVGHRIGKNGWDGVSTPNHRHYLSNGQIKRSDELKIGDEIVNASQWKWNGKVPSKLPYKNWSGFEDLSLEEFCEFAGYFVTEGHVKHEKSKNLRKEVQGQAFGISQNTDSECYESIKGLMTKISSRMYVHSDDRRTVSNHTFIVANAPLARIIEDSFGSGSLQKHVPNWMLNLPERYLRILADAMMEGDGDINGSRFRFSTVSERLKDQTRDIMMKLGFSTYVREENQKIENRNTMYRIYWSSTLKPKKFKINILEEIDYEGKMWCLEMPNKNFFIEIDGHILLTGNTSGKVLQITQEMEHIDKELLDGLMLNQALLNGEMCIPEEDRMLTKDGFKNLDEISEDDEIATYDADRKCLEYQKPTDIHVYDYDGDLTHFQTDRLDFACTPNHQMLYQKRDSDEWIIDKAESVRDRAKFVKTMKWFSGTNFRLSNHLAHPDFIDNDLRLDDYIKIVAYYVTEGHLQHETRKERSTYGNPTGVHLSQTEKGKAWEDLCSFQKECETYRVKSTRHGFAIYNKHLAEHLHENCGELSEFKYLPQHIKNLQVYHLKKLLMYMIDGDGALRTRDKHGPKKYYTYYTKSKQLRDDVMEISLKCGYFPRFRHRRDIWEVTFSDYDLGQKTIPLESKKHKTITQMPYKGKVWCVTVPNSYVITERNGKLMVSHNSGYQSAQVGVETLIRRIESWRQSLAEWVQDRVFKPISEMQGFVDEEKSEEVGETVFLHPMIDWNDLELKDQTQYHQMLMQLHDKQVISTQTLLEEIGMNYDQEVKRMRYEQAQMGPMGAQMGQEQGGGMGMDAMGGGGGAGGAGGEEMPGMGMDPMGGMGGGMDAGMGGGGMGGGGAAPAAAAGATGKITKKGKGNQGNEDEEVAPMMPIKLTAIEQKMAGMLEDVAGTMGFPVGNIRMQFPVENPKGGKAFSMDFAIPSLKINVEADGEVWHSSEEQESSDQERDYTLAQRGWTVLRFDDKSIEESTQQVSATINSYIDKAMKAQGGGKKASVQSNEKGNIGYFVGTFGRLKDFKGEPDKYYGYLDRTYPTRNPVHSGEVFN